MKKQVVRTFAALGLMLMLTTISVSAQSERRMVINIPFDFIIGKSALKAGQYTVEPRERNFGSVWMIRNRSNHAAVFVMTMPVSSKTQQEGMLVFHKYGDQFFLSQIWIPGSATGGELYISGLERDVAKNSVKGLLKLARVSDKKSSKK